MSPNERRWGMDPAEWREAEERLLALLVDAARSRTTVTYGQAARTAFGGRFSARSGALMDLLGDVDTRLDAERGVTIASLVVRQDTGMPGDGYFSFLSRLRPDVGTDREAAWRAEAQAVWDAYREPVR